MTSDSSSNQDKAVLVLLSGGIDSTACVEFYLSQQSSVNALFVEYGQLSAKQEIAATKRICYHYGISLSIVSCNGAQGKTSGLIQGRNAFLLCTALMEFGKPSGIIAIGVHAGTSYSDCSKRFLKTVQVIFDDYADGCIRVGAPFLEWTKRDIWDYCLDRQVPLQLTYSCELGQNQPCGQCLSCRDLESLRALSKLNT